MSEAMTGFVPGGGVGVVGSGTWILVERAPTDLVERLLELVRAGEDADALVEVLAASGLRTMGSFALARVEPGGLRLVLRGEAAADVVVHGEAREIDAVALRTWTETVVPAWQTVVLRLGPPADTATTFRLEAGVVPAVALVHPAGVPAPAPATTSPESEQGGPASPAAEEPTATSATAGAPVDGAVTATTLHASLLDIATEGGLDAAPGEAGAAADGGDPETDSPYDALYGQTVARSVQEAAVAEPDADEPLAPPTPTTAVSQPPPVLGDHDGRTISAAAMRALRAAPPDEPGDHDGRTMSLAQLAALRAGAPDPPLSGSPTVAALVCSAGHPNPPHEARCRRCAAPLATEAVVIDRPSLGRLQLSTGEEIDLDRPLLIGRNPKLEGRLMSELPRTVKLEHLQGLSRTHAMISPEGWQVFVVDLGSVNHTTVTLPGRPPRQLHADEPVPIVHGTTIDFGGEVTATYDADAGAT